MKVLWFTFSPSLAAGYLNIPVAGRGWIESLQERIKAVEDIDLGVGFVHGKKNLNKFTYENATYYGMPSKGGRIKKFIDRHFNNLNDDELIKYCLEVVNDFKPDVIHIFGTEEAFGLICDKVNVPVVIHLQGLLTIYEKKWFPPGISRFDLLKNSDISDIIRANTLIKHYKYFNKASRRERQIFKAGKYFIGRTDWDRRVTAVLAPEAEYFFGSEILRKEFYWQMWSYPNNKTKIFTSTIQANIYKGLETVLECGVLLKNLNKFDFKWIIAGISNRDEIVKIFEKKASKKFIDYNIILSGKLSAADLITTQLTADVFIHPSHIDNSPNSVCEAMVLGMPVIATYTGGTGSLLADKKEGILIQDGDAYSMAGAILEVVNNPEYAAELGKNARIRARERHNPDTITSDLISIYSKIIPGQSK
jgi:glycosyltransferase involved in cell wall biosynthesis